MAKYRFNVAISYTKDAVALELIVLPWYWRVADTLASMRWLMRIPGYYHVWQLIVEQALKHEDTFTVPIESDKAFKEWAGWDDFEDDE